ncbi:hypothetical protein D3C71_1443430 [compost metagenome]
MNSVVNYVAFWLDETRYVIVPSRRHKKLKEEFDATLVAARLLEWEYSVCKISDGYEVIFTRVEGNEMNGMILFFMKSGSHLDRIGISTVNGPMKTEKDWLQSIRKFRNLL